MLPSAVLNTVSRGRIPLPPVLGCKDRQKLSKKETFCPKILCSQPFAAGLWAEHRAGHRAERRAELRAGLQVGQQVERRAGLRAERRVGLRAERRAERRSRPPDSRKGWRHDALHPCTVGPGAAVSASAALIHAGQPPHARSPLPAPGGISAHAGSLLPPGSLHTRTPHPAPDGYFSPRRCFSQAQAEASVSSSVRSAFQPSSVLASVGSAQMAMMSPSRRGAIL